MTEDIRELHDQVKSLYERIIQLEREVATLRATIDRQPVYVPLPVAPPAPYPNPYWVITSDQTNALIPESSVQLDM